MRERLDCHRIADARRRRQSGAQARGDPGAARRSVAALIDSGRGFDENRLHQEAILLASKADIREELDRLKTHVAAARALIEEGGAIGRRLDFLAQELSREASTARRRWNSRAGKRRNGLARFWEACYSGRSVHWRRQGGMTRPLHASQKIKL